MKLLKKLFKLLFLLFIIFGLIALGYYLAVTKDATLNENKLLLASKTITLYDSKGELFTPISLGDFKESIPLSSIPKTTKQAFISTEDRSFYKHNGFNKKRFFKALLNNIKAHSFKEGASTISQQLIKNTHLSQDKTLKRKLQEWKLTKQLEKNYTKDEILEKYLNVIYFGHNCFGIKSASQFYFGKAPDQLDLADSAILAGLVKSPNNYSPFKHPSQCLKRKEIVLNGMLKTGAITQEDKGIAMQKALPKQPFLMKSNHSYTRLIFDELEEIAEQNNFSVGGQIEIFTYLDKDLQTHAEALANAYGNFDKTIAVLDAKSLGFKCYASSLGNTKRLPGSLIKPLLVYAPSLEENLISPATAILDEEINYAGYSPSNYDKQFHGYVSIRECLAKSLNIPAVKQLDSLGVSKACDYMQKMNLKIEKEDYSLALALGGMKEGFSLTQLMSAYSTFQREGEFANGSCISQIKINGNTVYKRKIQTKKVFSADTVYLLNDMLKTTAKSGTAKKLRTLPFPICAKTGTAGTSQGNTDAYALSYTTKDCVGIWLGNASNEKIYETGGGEPCNILLNVNRYLADEYKKKNTSIEDFKKPKNIVDVCLDKISYYDTHTLCIADQKAPKEYCFTELFKKSSMPLKTSDLFTNPNIKFPLLTYQNGQVTITFDNTFPSFYTYKIERYDYATHTTLYYGQLPDTVIDNQVKVGKKYTYSITPYYNNVKGQTVSLPTVYIGPSSGKIIEKNWWDY